MASLYVQRYKAGWSIKEQTYDKGKSIQKTIPREAYVALGIDASWTLEQAKSRIKELNASNSAHKSDQRAIVRSAERVKRRSKSENIWLPTLDVQEFEWYLKKTNMGSDEHFDKRLRMWETAKKVISHLNVDPRVYSDFSKGFFNYFISKTYSTDYCNKLLSLINQWGGFYSKRRGVHYEPIRYPTSNEKEKIRQAYRKSDICREGGSARLTPEILDLIKSKLREDQYQWLHISLWFGLRPEEIEQAQFSTYTDTRHKIQVLRIWSSKVQKWKFIPILYPDQHTALSWLRPLKRPLNKTIQAVTGNKRFTAYAGRKGFEKLMTKLGENLTDISAWLGHSSLRTTKTYYEDQEKVVLSRKVS